MNIINNSRIEIAPIKLYFSTLCSLVFNMCILTNADVRENSYPSGFNAGIMAQLTFSDR